MRAKRVEERRIELRAFHMQSERSTTELHPLVLFLIVYLRRYYMAERQLSRQPACYASLRVAHKASGMKSAKLQQTLLTHSLSFLVYTYRY
jgi:hypothetical protein